MIAAQPQIRLGPCHAQPPSVAGNAASGIRRRPRPSIIYILADDLGYGRIGSYRQKQIKTPNIDKMAAVSHSVIKSSRPGKADARTCRPLCRW